MTDLDHNASAHEALTVCLSSVFCQVSTDVFGGINIVVGGHNIIEVMFLCKQQ